MSAERGRAPRPRRMMVGTARCHAVGRPRRRTAKAADVATDAEIRKPRQPLRALPPGPYVPRKQQPRLPPTKTEALDPC